MGERERERERALERERERVRERAKERQTDRQSEGESARDRDAGGCDGVSGTLTPILHTFCQVRLEKQAKAAVTAEGISSVRALGVCRTLAWACKTHPREGLN